MKFFGLFLLLVSASSFADAGNQSFKCFENHGEDEPGWSLKFENNTIEVNGKVDVVDSGKDSTINLNRVRAASSYGVAPVGHFRGTVPDLKGSQFNLSIKYIDVMNSSDEWTSYHGNIIFIYQDENGSTKSVDTPVNCYGPRLNQMF